MESRIDRERYWQERREIARYYRQSDWKAQLAPPVKKKRTVKSETKIFGRMFWLFLCGIAREFCLELLKLVGLL